MVAPCIEKDIAHCFSQTILTSTFEEIGDDVFALLVDKSINLMLKILGITNISSQALQRKDQDIMNAISLVKSTTTTLKKMRNDSFDALMLDIAFSVRIMLNMVEVYVNPRIRRQYTNISNRHYYEVFCFNMLFGILIQEFSDRFSEIDGRDIVTGGGGGGEAVVTGGGGGATSDESGGVHQIAG
ncbi:uncharacterized protein LOC111916923 [Lactuca sativa]|uniref:uncharacterized protein LOC111916923 n=1 Tax=Lactuca sativa TaxID=4236 RepID=UPI000CD7FDC0|nr:uncharacterized protein LOC111916923 [Lactuca sativa]